MVARRAHNPKVEGSSPSPATRCGGVAQLARAFGSYPECHWFESSRRYHKPCEACLTGFFRCAGFRGSLATPFGRSGGPPPSKGMRIARLRASGAFASPAKAPGKKGPRTRLHAKTRKAQGFAGYGGTPGAVRTHGLQSRSLTLYPAELRARDSSRRAAHGKAGGTRYAALRAEDIVPSQGGFVKGFPRWRNSSRKTPKIQPPPLSGRAESCIITGSAAEVPGVPGEDWKVPQQGLQSL